MLFSIIDKKYCIIIKKEGINEDFHALNTAIVALK
jgi:hypothetical protein